MIKRFFKEAEKEDTGRGSWASFDIRTAKPDDPVPGLLDKVVTMITMCPCLVTLPVYYS